MKSIYWITNKTENKAIIIIIIIINLSTPCFVLPSPSLWSTVPFKFSAKIFCAPSGFPPDETLWSRVRTWTASRRCAPFRAFLGDCTAWIAFRSAGTWTGDRRCGSSCAISAMACPQIPSGRNREQMDAEVVPALQYFAAHLARVTLTSVLGFHVGLEATHQREALAAFIAREGPRAGSADRVVRRRGRRTLQGSDSDGSHNWEG